MWKDRFRGDAGNPLEPGNALKNKNFDKAFFRFNGVAVLLTMVLTALAVLLVL